MRNLVDMLEIPECRNNKIVASRRDYPVKGKFCEVSIAIYD